MTRIQPLREGPPARSRPASLLGSQVRALRMAAGASGGELAARCGISRFFGDQPSRTDFSHVRAGHGIQVDRVGAVADYRYELLGHLLSGNLFVEPYLVTLLPGAEPYVTFQHPGLKFQYLLSGEVRYRYGAKVVELGAGDSLLFEASALHGIEAIGTQPVTYLSVVFTLRD